MTEVICGEQGVMMLDEMTASALAETFKVLSDSTRVRIISALVERELCVHELSEALGLSHSATSHQLAMLREMRLVAATKRGRHKIYRLDDEHIADLFQQGLAHILHT
ncbi:MAG: winged helix-turn-helix transcriptional regulator [Anaerolineae bacterium]|nr:winged helix-turn-helix transcriptional regulator [Anaerolineae bacterium]